MVQKPMVNCIGQTQEQIDNANHARPWPDDGLGEDS